MDSMTIAKRTMIVIFGLFASCGGGGGSSPEVSVIVPPPNRVARFAYVANALDNSVSAYAVDIATGRIKYTGKVATGLNPVSVTVDTSGKYAYVANSGDGTVSQYKIETDGQLTSLGPNVSSGPGPQSVTVDPSGRYAYVANSGDGTVSQYKIESDGQLTSLGPNVSSGPGPQSVTVDPSGRYAYVANYDNDSLSAYTISSGVLTQIDADLTIPGIQDFSSGHFPASVTVDPLGKYAYVTNSGDDTVSQYKIEAGGRLKAMNPATVMAGLGPWSITVDLSGRYAYVANLVSGTVSQYTIDPSNGSLSANSVADAIPAGTEPRFVAVDRNTNYVYVTNYTSNDISLYSIDPVNGSLSPIAPYTLSALPGPNSFSISHGMSPAVAVPKYAYVANSGGNSISQYQIEQGGNPVKMVASMIMIDGGSIPVSIVVDPSGQYAYVANRTTNNVSTFSIDALSGELTQIDANPLTTIIDNTPAGTNPQSVIVDPSGRYVYVANIGSNSISQYLIGTNGILEPMIPASVPAGTHPSTQPWAVTVDPSGKYVYVANWGTSDVSAYTIDRSTGNLTQIDADSGPVGIQNFHAVSRADSITVDPSGRYVYVANFANGTLDTSYNDNISQYSIGTNGFIYQLTPPTVDAGGSSGSRSIAVNPNGKHAYVANESGDISQYEIATAIGAEGSLSLLSAPTVSAGVSPYSVTVDPGGNYVYVVNEGSGNLLKYSIDTDGSLMMPPVSIDTGLGPRSISIVGSYQ